MVITLYHFPKSPPSRGALLAAKAVGVNVDVKIVNLSTKEQLKEEFVKVKLEQLLILYYFFYIIFIFYYYLYDILSYIFHNIMKYCLRLIHNILYQL